MYIALTRRPSAELAECELSFLEREPIDLGLALAQHVLYCRELGDLGVEVHTLAEDPEHPDAVFVEDTAVVFGEAAVICSMGATSRRSEQGPVETFLRRYREVAKVELPSRIDGGDVQWIPNPEGAGDTFLVGVSGRTDRAGVQAFREIATRYGHSVVPVETHGCLHLKSACTRLPDGRLLVNPQWIETEPLEALGAVAIPETEPWAADVLTIGASVLLAEEHPETSSKLESLGYDVRATPLSEFAKAEAGVTCLSIVFEAAPA